MTPDFLLVHREGARRFSNLENVSHFSFITCLRHVVIVDPDSLASFEAEIETGDVLLAGEEAYAFLLEVICGLRSPLLGETEVYGQFKNAASSFTVPATPWGGLVSRTFKNLFEDAKKIRQAHLEDLGSQSYGSILRRELKGLSRVHVIGSGHLVQEILPWIAKDGTSIVIHCRDLAKAEKSLGELAAKVELVSLDERRSLAAAEAVIVAAPVSAKWLRAWLPESAPLKTIVDFRADSATDRFAHAVNDRAIVLDLPELLGRLNTNQTLLQERKRGALDAIEASVAARARHVEYRPFGWDDVCA
ncbi:MAG: hypothetical protein V4760_16060 [Bdellovibrionota bacterium]